MEVKGEKRDEKVRVRFLSPQNNCLPPARISFKASRK
jgi:hypothetical protein